MPSRNTKTFVNLILIGSFSLLSNASPYYMGIGATLKACLTAAGKNMGHPVVKKVPLKSREELQLGKFIGQGKDAVVYCDGGDCSTIFKLYLKIENNPVREEAAGALKLSKLGVPTPKIVKSSSFEYIVKEFIPGPTLTERLKTGPLSDAEMESLAEIFKRLKRAKTDIDYMPGNFILDQRSIIPRWVVVDTLDINPATPSVFLWAEGLFSGYPAEEQRFLDLADLIR